MVFFFQFIVCCLVYSSELSRVIAIDYDLNLYELFLDLLCPCICSSIPKNEWIHLSGFQQVIRLLTIFPLTETKVDEKILELKRKDDIIAKKEQIILDKSDSISSLQTEISSLQVNHLSIILSYFVPYATLSLVIFIFHRLACEWIAPILLGFFKY